ncbi:MAG: HPF/RaiA family ribosome-associated protein [Bacteroides sp.]|nr:HPF/RaiA family ribosome-associated protein [Prevotella sp.]MCM1408792.1 HPF/RaiA family ribosome-associated protein [Treponema brennaborense]MCM1470572.1 HPF/RaiA family ribosome-associated protein [Bacteroides sp.]
MNITTNAVGFEIDKDQQSLVDKKLERIKYADDLIVDLLLKIKEDKKYIFDATVNFRWGASAHVSADEYDFAAALNKLMDMLDLKIKKEKDKIQQKN